MTWPLGYTVLPLLAGGTAAYAYGISGDGLVIVGEADDSSFNLHAVYWTELAGPVDLGFLPGGDFAYANAANSDGSVIVGISNVGSGGSADNRGFRWTQAGGMVEMQPLSSPGAGATGAYGVSADGSIVVGVADDSTSAQHAVIWDAAGNLTTDLGFLTGGTFAVANGISADGTAIVGYADTAADANLHAFRWTAGGGMVDISVASDSNASAGGASSDGAVVAGNAGFSGTGCAFRWTAGGGLASLGLLPGGSFSSALSITDDGSIIVGSADDSTAQQRAFEWTAGGGMVALPDLAGVGPSDSYTAQAVARGGSAMAGYAPVTTPPTGYATVPVHYTGEAVLERTGAIFAGAVDKFVISLWQYGFSNTQRVFIDDGTRYITVDARHQSGGGSIVVGVTGPLGNIIDANYTTSLPLDCPCNFLISFDLTNSLLQVYANDAPLSTALSWTSPAPLTFNNATSTVTWGDPGSPAFWNCAGYAADFWAGRTGAFVDLSVAANRRKFLNADLTPVDLGATGSAPFGTAPEVYQSIRPGGVAADWLTNLGTAGGSFAIDSGGIELNGNPCDAGPVDTAWVYGLSAGPPPDPNFPLTGVVKVLLPPAELQFCDANGLPYAAGTLEFYQPDSTTPKDTWNSPLGGDDHLNSNPLVLDSAGRALIYGDGAYRTVLRDAAGNLVWDQPSFTYVSACMVPVVGAADLATARQAMGITDAIEAEAEARAAADSAEASARASADATLQSNIDAETARAEAAEAALGARIDGLPAPAPPGNTQGAGGTLDASGHTRVTFGTPFATDGISVVITGQALGVQSGAFNVANLDRFGFDVWGSIFGSRTPASGVEFYWLAIGD